MPQVVTLSDIHVYLTLAQSYRCYIRREHELYGKVPNVWGSSKRNAIARMAEQLAERNIPFDFTYDW